MQAAKKTQEICFERRRFEPEVNPSYMTSFSLPRQRRVVFAKDTLKGPDVLCSPTPAPPLPPMTYCSDVLPWHELSPSTSLIYKVSVLVFEKRSHLKIKPEEFWIL
jgi:hypothetical protein